MRSARDDIQILALKYMTDHGDEAADRIAVEIAQHTAQGDWQKVIRWNRVKLRLQRLERSICMRRQGDRSPSDGSVPTALMQRVVRPA